MTGLILKQKKHSLVNIKSKAKEIDYEHWIWNISHFVY